VRRRGLLLLGLVVTVGFGYLAVRGVQWRVVGDALGATRWEWLVPAMAVFALSNLAKAARWRASFPPEARPPLGPVTEALVLGYFFNNVLPARAGEAVRVIALHRRTDTSRARSTATVVLERVFDVLSLLVLLFLALPLLPEVTWVRAAVVLAVVLAVAITAALVVLAVYEDRALRVILRPLSRLRWFTADRVDITASRLTHGLAALRRPRVALAAFSWSVAAWLIMAASYWLVMVAFELDLPPHAGLFVLIAVGLGMILPSSTAAIVVFEAAVVAALVPYGVEKSVALSYGLVLHALTFVFYVVAGAVGLRMHTAALRRGAEERAAA
jgi:uncharacterized protein (TIRG00374 family)